MSKARSDKPVKVDLGKTLGDRIARLKDPDVIRALGAKTVKRLRKQVVAEILRAKREACSPVWSDDVIHRGVEYPPGGKDTGMVRCATCQVWHPADYLTTSGHGTTLAAAPVVGPLSF